MGMSGLESGRNGDKMREQKLQEMIANVVKQVLAEGKKGRVPVEVSARHVHLTKEDTEALFGKGHVLTPRRELSQPGQFLAEERVTIVTARGEFRNVAVLGPARSHTQVELSCTDARSLGVEPLIRQSGDTAGCPDICLLAGQNVVVAKEAVIVAQNHIHMTPEDAKNFGVHDGQMVRVEMNTVRPLTFDQVAVRVRDDFALAMHIDFDEANACGFKTGDWGQVYLAGEVQADGVHDTGHVARKAADLPQYIQCATGLITESRARELAQECGSISILHVDKKAVLTPSAWDVMREKKIEVVRRKDP